MFSLSEKLDRVNKLRKQALSDPEYAESAKAHELAIKTESHTDNPKTKAKPKKKRFSDVYKDITFGAERPIDTH